MKQTTYRQPLASLPLEQSTKMTINNDCSWISTPNRLDTPSSKSCSNCYVTFNIVKKKHQCKNCMSKFCGNCSKQRLLRKEGKQLRARLCDDCADMYFSSTIKSSGDKLAEDENDPNGANGGDNNNSSKSENAEVNDSSVDITFFRLGYSQQKADVSTPLAALSTPASARAPLMAPAEACSTPSTGSMFREVNSVSRRTNPSPNSSTAKAVLRSAAKSARKEQATPVPEIAMSPPMQRISPAARKRTVAQSSSRNMRIFICIVIIAITSLVFGLMSLAARQNGFVQHRDSAARRAASKVVPKEHLVHAAPEPVFPDAPRGNIIVVKVAQHRSRLGLLLREIRRRAVQQLRDIPQKGAALKAWVRALLKKHEITRVRFNKI